MKKANKAFIFLLAMLTPQTTLPAQTPRGVVRGIVTRDGTNDPVPFAQVVLNLVAPASFLETVSAAIAAQGAPAALMQSQAAQLMTIPLSTLQSNIDALKAQGAPAAMIAMMTAAQSFREGRGEFPIRTAADAAGRFAIPNILPGGYSLTIQHNGFFGKPADEKSRPTDSVSAAVTVPSQGDPPETAVSMLAGAVIHGTVRDSDGNLIPNASVQAAGPAIPQPMTVKANEMGEYRFFWLPPGQYRISVNPPSRPFAVTTAAGAAVPEPYVQTFFPDVVDASLAAPISVKSGDELADVNIMLRTGIFGGVQSAAGGGAAGGFKVSGQVVNTVRLLPDSSGKVPPTTATLVLVPRSTSAGSPGPIRTVGAVAVISESSSFEVPGIASGSYDLYARLADTVASAGRGPGRGLYVFGLASIDVSNRDLDNVTITIHSPVDVNGKLTIDGVVDPERSKTLMVDLSSTGSANAFPNYQGANFGPQTPKPDGTFTIPNAAEATYLTRISGLSPGWYVADVRQGSVSVYDSGISVTNKTPELVEIAVMTNGGRAEGIVYTADHMPAPSTRVMLIPSAEHRRNPLLSRSAITNAQGRFGFDGLRPDTYTVFAWEGIPPDITNPDVLAKYESQGTAVKIAPTSTTRIEVAVIPKPTPQ